MSGNSQLSKNRDLHHKDLPQKCDVRRKFTRADGLSVIDDKMILLKDNILLSPLSRIRLL